MLTVSKVASGAEAGKYYPEGQEQNRDYYTSSQAPSEWHGRGAEALGLAGPVTYEQLRDALNGREEVFGRQLGTMKGGEHQRLGGVDFTFNAPKSVSIMAADGLGQDKRVVDAHDRAVSAALRHVEDRVSTRIREDGGIRREATGNMAVARFREDFTRPVRDPDAGGKAVPDPHLHTHCVAINATQSADGQWRSLDTAQFFNESFIKEATLVYRQELARELRDLGYELNVQRDGSFEIHGVTREAVEAFSRRSEQIEEKLAEQGKDRTTATAEEKLAANKSTREAKVYADQGSRVQDWQERSARVGLDARGLADQAHEWAGNWEYQAQLRTEAHYAAREAVRFAADKLAEREAAFSDRALRQEAAMYAVGKANAGELARAIAEATGRDGYLHERTVREVNPSTREQENVAGWTTTKALATERDMLAAERLGRNRLEPTTTREEARAIVARAEAVSRAGGHTWTDSQRRATERLLTSSHRVNGIQGYAGTAKTTTVLATYAKEMQARGVEVKAMAPTASAADTLGKALGVEARTVQRHLVDGQRIEHQQRAAGAGVEANPGPERQVWVVDEASLLSAKQMGELLRQANDQNARVVLVGDVKQLGSVEAGRAFGQLQEGGMTTHKLDEIVRQTNASTLDGIYAAIQGDAKAALERIEHGGGQVKELGSAEERRAEIAKDYLSLSAQDLERTIVIDPSREGRSNLNEKIREGLKAEGTLKGAEARATILEAKGLTKAEARDARSYSAGDVVRFGRAYEGQQIAKGEYLRVVSSNSRNNTITLQSNAGRTIEWNPRQWGATRSEAFKPAERGIQAGDRITWTRNDDGAGRKNGQSAAVERVDRDQNTATVRLENGQTQTIDLAARNSQHWDHAYAQTAHAAQGRTSDRVMVHAESHRQNLTNQKSFYVSLSRARDEARVYTDNRERLIDAIKERAGEKQAAHDRTPLGARADQAHQARTSDTRRATGADRQQPARRGEAADRRQGPAPKTRTPAPPGQRRGPPSQTRPAGGRRATGQTKPKERSMSDQHRGGPRPQVRNATHTGPAQQEHNAQHDPGRAAGRGTGGTSPERRGALGERDHRGQEHQRQQSQGKPREAPKPARVIAERSHSQPRQQPQREQRSSSPSAYSIHMAREAKALENALSHPSQGHRDPTVGEVLHSRLEQAQHQLLQRAERALTNAADRMIEKAAHAASDAVKQGVSRAAEGAHRQLNNAVSKALGEHNQARSTDAGGRKGALGETRDRVAMKAAKGGLEHSAGEGKGGIDKEIGRSR